MGANIYPPWVSNELDQYVSQYLHMSVKSMPL